VTAVNMPPAIAAIPTQYNGVSFRSRAEARWAMFFDLIGVAWMYEAEGYDLDGLKYLPDFWLPEQDCFWEVKPNRSYDRAKPRALADVTRKKVYVGWDLNVYITKQFEDGSADLFSPDEGESDPDGPDDQHHNLCKCCCGLWTVQYGFYAGRHCDSCDYAKEDAGAEISARAARQAIEFRFSKGPGTWHKAPQSLLECEQIKRIEIELSSIPSFTTEVLPSIRAFVSEYRRHSDAELAETDRQLMDAGFPSHQLVALCLVSEERGLVLPGVQAALAPHR
jgi:hypothetical protein